MRQEAYTNKSDVTTKIALMKRLEDSIQATWYVWFIALYIYL